MAVMVDHIMASLCKDAAFWTHQMVMYKCYIDLLRAGLQGEAEALNRENSKWASRYIEDLLRREVSQEEFDALAPILERNGNELARALGIIN